MDSSLPNPFRKDSRAQAAAPPGMGMRDWARLYVMGFVLLVIIGGMVFMSDAGKPRKNKARPGPGISIEPVATQTAPESPAAEEEEKIEVELTELPTPGEGEIDFRALAAPFKDGRDAQVKETPEFVSLLKVFINQVAYGDLAKRINPTVTADQAYRDPGKHRGEVFRVRGRLIKDYPERFNATIPENLEIVYLWVMQERPTGRTVCFYTAEKPRDPETGNLLEFNASLYSGKELLTDWIEIEGVFLRQYDYAAQYKNRDGEDVQNGSALMFVKDFRIVERAKSIDTRTPFAFIVLGLGVVIAAIVLVAGVMSRKYGSGTIRMKMHAVRRSKGEVVFPAANPKKQILGDEIPAPPSTDEKAGDPPESS